MLFFISSSDFRKKIVSRIKKIVLKTVLDTFFVSFYCTKNTRTDVLIIAPNGLFVISYYKKDARGKWEDSRCKIQDTRGKWGDARYKIQDGSGKLDVGRWKLGDGG